MPDAQPPLLSVLLPTRNRLDYLRYAVETVRRQDDGDWELVVSDNDSEEDIAGYVSGLADPRIRYVRTASFVPVTDNWNNALRHSRGRYVVMLGDDDGLMPGYVAAIRRLSRRFGDPDVIYQSAWLFSYPGVDPSEPEGFLQAHGYAKFLRGATAPFELDRATARKMVAHAMRFQLRYGFNMQFSTVSRRLIDELAPQGPFFQSAFPDYFATNVAFLTAQKIVVTPQPLVMIGVTPKSYGFFHLNAQEQAGKAFLEAEGDAAAAGGALALAEMPGTNINTGWLSALEAIAARYPALAPAAPDRRRFRVLQAVHVYEGHFLGGTLPAEQVAAVDRHLRPWERRLARAAVRACKVAGPRLPPRVSQAFHNFFFGLVLGQFIAWDPPKVRGSYRTLLDVFERPPPPPPVAHGQLHHRLRRTTV
ncbi:MAG TPA: glycosyltransferase family A protein [Solirubrobacteraceae bacterium]|nr:glycosyltransferase family A protein [Solirubrobacteraceae bacterium]